MSLRASVEETLTADDPTITFVRYGELGDVVLTSGVAHTLKAYRPDAQIRLLTHADYRDLMTGSVFDDVEGATTEQLRSPIAAVRRSIELRRRRSSVVVDLHASPRRRVGWLIGLSAGRIRVGYDHRWNRRFADVRLTPRAYEGRHYVELACDAIRPILGDAFEVRPPSLPYTEADNEAGAKLLASAGLRGATPVAIVPGGRLAFKTWSVARFAAVADGLARDGVTVVVIGSRQDAATLREFTATSPTRVVTASTVGELKAVLGQCRLMIGNDSGPKHLAAALGVPTVAVHGPADPAIWGALGDGHVSIVADVKCRPCNSFTHCPTGTRDCLIGVSTQEVLDAARRALGVWS